jgi:transcriptional regulator with XRE-family HTH domain
LSIAMRLQKLRTAKRESLQDVADAIGASKGHVWELEKGTAKNPSVDLLRKLAEHFGVTIATLIGENPSDEHDEQLLVMFRDLQSLSDADRAVLDDIIKGMKRRHSES